MSSSVKRRRGTAAKRILQKKIATVVNIAKANPTQFGNELMENGLVPVGVVNPDDRTQNKEQTATLLYLTCMDTVKVSPEKFVVMMEILSDYTSLDTAVKEMENEGELYFLLLLCVLLQQQITNRIHVYI